MPNSRLADPQHIIADLQRELDECRAERDKRTAERDEALQQQTATAEVLQVINSSPGDLGPVFDAILEKALRLCQPARGHIWRIEGQHAHAVAVRGDPDFVEWLRQQGAQGPVRGSSVDRLGQGEPFVHMLDARRVEPYRTNPWFRELIDRSGCRTSINVPLRKDGVLLGTINLYRPEVQAFSDKQIALLQNFAAQAVIAMENARLINETREALERQTATAEVLQVINSSPGDLAPVFDAMLERAMQLCEAAFGGLWTFEHDRYVAVAMRNVPTACADFFAKTTAIPGPGTAPYRFLYGERLAHEIDLASTEPYKAADPARRALVDLGGARTALQVPLRKEDHVLGVITIYRQEIRPFSDKQIALLENFAAQAVIAMENARLLTETHEALEQQTATAEVLQVINSSPGDLAPVFQAMLQNAHALCEASFGALMTYDGELFHAVAHQGTPAPFREFLASGIHPGPRNPFGRMVEGAALSHIHDLSEVATQYPGEALPRAAVDLGGIRTFLIVPLRKDTELLGAITAYRQEVRPFTDKQIALLQNFAAQPVIAMENARLINETREALEQQTATAEVLEVINSSPGDLTPVFDAILEKAHTLCGAAHGSLQLYDSENLHAVTTHAVSDKFAEILRQGYRAADSPASRALIEGEPFIQISDCAEIDHPVFRSAAELSGIRTVVFVPLRRDDAFLGLISAARLEVRPFTDKQIALLQNFAAQAVISMENARLITETREALEQQTATAEILQVTNSSPGDLAPVFDAILEKAHTLCGATLGSLFLFDGELSRAAATHGYPDDLAQRLRQGVILSSVPQLLEGARCVHNPDLRLVENPTAGAVSGRGGVRTNLMLPLRKDGRLLGTIS